MPERRRPTGPERSGGADYGVAPRESTAPVNEPPRQFRPLIPRYPIYRLLRVAAVTLGVAFIAAVVAVGWAFETGRAVEVVRKDIVNQLEARCGVRAEFAELKVAPLERELSLTELSLTNLDGEPLLAVEEAIVSVQVFPLFYGRYQLERVALLAPSATLRFRDGRIVNLPRCVQPPEGSTESRSALPIALGVSELTIERGAVDLVYPGDLRIGLDDVGVAIEREATGGTGVAIGVDDVEVTWPEHALTVQRFRLLGRLEGLLTQPRALVVDRLEVLAAERARIEGRGSLDLIGPVFDIRMQVDLPIDLVPRFVDGAPGASGRVGLDVHLTGTPLSPRARGELALTELRVGNYGPFGQARLVFVVDRAGLDVTDIDVQHAGGRVEGTARLGFEKGLPFEAAVVTDNLSLAQLLHSLNVPSPWVDLRADGPAEVRGTLAPVELIGPFDFRVEDLVVFDRGFDAPEVQGPLDEVPREFLLLRTAPCRARGTWHFEPQNLHFVDSEVLADGSSGDVWARIGFKPELGHDIGARFAPLDFRDLGPIANVAFEGDGSFDAEMHIPIGAKPKGDAQLDFAGFTIADIPFGYVASSLRFRDGNVLELPDVRGQLGASKYQGRARVEIAPGVPSEFELELSDGQLEDLLIPFGVVASDWGEASGRARGEARLEGPIQGLSGPIELAARDVEIYGERFARVEAGIEMVDGAIRVDRFRAEKGGGKLTGLGRFEPRTRRLTAHAWTLGLELADLDAIAGRYPMVSGELDLDLRLEGPIDAATGRYTVDLREVKTGQIVLGSGLVQGPIDGPRVGVSANLFAGRAQLDGTLSFRRDLPYSAQFELTELPILSIVSELTDSPVQGSLTTKGELEGSLSDVRATNGRIEASLVHLEGFGLVLDAPRPVQLQIEKGAVSTDRLDLVGPGARLFASGRAGWREADLDLTGRLELSLLETFVPQIERGSGDLRFDAHVFGRWSDLDVVGTAVLRQGFARWSWIEEPITELDADLRFSQRRIIVESGRGRWASGRIEVEGRTSVDSGGFSNLDLGIRVDRAAPTFLLPAADVSGRLVGDLRLAGSGEQFRLTGALQASNPRIEPKIDLRSLVDYRAPPSTYDPRAEMFEFDVRVEAGDTVRVKSDAVDLELDGAVRLTGTNQRPGLLGNASVVSGGRVTFLGRSYSFRTGTVEFRDRYEFAPQYDLTLAAEACSSRIRINITGTLDEFETVYSSTPEMDPRDVVSCLLRGIRIRELDDERAIGAFAGNTLLKLSGVDQEVKKVVPIDQIDVTSEFSSQAREYQPYVLLAKELSFLSTSARLEYQSSLLQTTDQRAALRLRLTPRLNLTFGWASSLDVPLGDWGLDLKHRWEW